MKNSLGASLGICAFVVTYLALGVLSGFTVIWGIFGAWGTYYTNGKGTDNLQKTITSTIYGAVLSGVAVVLHGYLDVAGSFAWPIAVGLTVYAMTVLVGNKHFANVPGVVFGYTMAIGYMLTAGTADTYTVTASKHYTSGGAPAAKTNALSEASNHCKSLNKELLVTNATQSFDRPMYNYSVIFLCK